MRKCLETFGKRVVDRAETIDGVAAGQEVGKWTDNLLSVAEVSAISGFLSDGRDKWNACRKSTTCY